MTTYSKIPPDRTKYMIVVLFIILLFVFCRSACAQNIIGLSYAGNDHNLGLRYERQFNQRWGYYLASGYGNYKDKACGSVEHARGSIGLTRYLQNYAMDDCQFLFGFGPVYHYYHQYAFGYSELTSGQLFPVGFEISTGIFIERRLSCHITADVVKGDAYITFGYGFGRRR